MNRTLCAMNDNRWVDFELPGTAIGLPVSVRIGDFGGRWVAVVTDGADRRDGLGSSAREALLAALAPLGTRASMALMAEPVMFGASADLLARAAI
jgi:hypothetical protein